MNHSVELLMLKLTCLIMQQNRYQKYFAYCYFNSDLVSLKTEVDKLDIDKLVPVPVDLSKLSDVVKSDVVQKTV